MDDDELFYENYTNEDDNDDEVYFNLDEDMDSYYDFNLLDLLDEAEKLDQKIGAVKKPKF